MTATEESDETGIVLASSKGVEDGLHATCSPTCRSARPPRSHGASLQHMTTTVVISPSRRLSNGGDYIGTMIRAVKPDIGYRTVHATRAEYLQAEPVARIVQSQLRHMVGLFEKLEEQMAQYEPLRTEESPDRLDAMVYALVACKVECAKMTLNFDVYAPGEGRAGQPEAECRGRASPGTRGRTPTAPRRSEWKT